MVELIDESTLQDGNGVRVGGESGYQHLDQPMGSSQNEEESLNVDTIATMKVAEIKEHLKNEE